MKNRLTRALVGVTALALASGTVGIITAGSAFAATPPYEPDSGSIGSLTFYDAGGNQITGGHLTDAPFATYVQASTAGRAGDTKATLLGALPKLGQASGAWSSEPISGSTNYPNASAPGALGTSSLPLVTLTSSDETLAALVSDLPNSATDAYQGLYQIRIKTSGPGQPAGATYDSADITITGTGAGATWQLTYPLPTVTGTTTSLGAAPTSPQIQGTSVTLTATVSPAAPGTVQFYDGATPIGTPAAVTGGTASIATTGLSVATHSLTATFIPSNTLLFSGSTSSPVSYEIDHAAAATTTAALSVNPTTAPAFSAVSLHADVTKQSDSSVIGTGNGVVKFYDGVTLLGQASLTATGATLSYGSFAVATHSLTAQFVPSDTLTYNSSTSLPVSFIATTPLSAPASQTVDVNVPAGSLTITTPYSAAHPFDLGTTALDPNGTQITASAPFGTTANAAAAAQGVTITDTRSGNQPWTASATVTDFADGAATPDVINGQDLTFTSVTPYYLSGNALQAPDVTTHDITNTAIYGPTDGGSDGLKGTGHVVASATNGDGSVNIVGSLNLRAPTSTPAGTYTATLTFTIA